MTESSDHPDSCGGPSFASPPSSLTEPPVSCGGPSFASPPSSLAEPPVSCGGPSFASPPSSLAEPPGPTEWFAPANGVGPWPGPPPSDSRYDPELLREGDRRNVVDAYRYWTREAIVADIDRRRHRLHIAIENFGHDANIGSVVRTANAFAVHTVHIVGRRRWNRRGAMVTDRYQRLLHHETATDLLDFAARQGLTVVAVDNVAGAVRLEQTTLPVDCLLVFGSEGLGISDEARAGAELTVSIAQFGSTRSINVGVAAGIVMHAWISRHGHLDQAW